MPVKSASVAAAKARLSSLLVEVEAGHDVTITRRGKPVARLTAVIDTPPPARSKFDLAALREYVAEGSATGPRRRRTTVAQMRERDLL